MKRLALLVLCVALVFQNAWAQNRTITGKVTDDKGNALTGVDVSVPKTSIHSVTNATGTFTINVPATARQLQFSYVGFVTYTAPITASATVINASLTANAELEGVVVTGVKTVRRSEYAGAATKIAAAEIENRPVGSFDQVFQGRVPGVTALTTSGQPGSASAIIIRGQNSVIGGTSPLYIVDGIPVEEGVFQGFNINDFESIDVLRDAAATALYGSRGSAGVVVATTKKGRQGKTLFSYSTQYGKKSRPDFTYDMMDTRELLQAQEDYGRIVGVPQNQSINIPGWHYSKNNPAYATFSPAQQALYDRIRDSIGGINNNWRDVWFRDGSFSSHQISLSGGAGKTRVYSSLGLYNEEGITIRSGMKRVTLRNNVDFSDDKFSFNLSSNFAYVTRTFTQTDAAFNAGNPFLITNLSAPYVKAHNADGSVAIPTETEYLNNPNYYLPIASYDVSLSDLRYNNQLKATLGINSSYRITNDITASVTAGVDFRETQASQYGNRLALIRRTAIGDPTGMAGFQSESLTRFSTLNLRPSIGYRKVFGGRHDLDVNAYGEYIQENTKAFNLAGYGIDPRTPNTPAAITQGNAGNQLFAQVGGGKAVNSIISGLLTAKYTYEGKYTITGSYRRDGSSKLPQVNRWTGFYSIGGIWDIAKEDFITDRRTINTLRLKASYGSSGNANNFPRGAYPYQATYAASGTYSGLPLQVATYPGNDDLKWETTYTANIGVDFGFFRNRVYGDVNIYDRRTKNLFVELSLSATSGFGALAVNAGALQNKGVELSLNVDLVRDRDITLTAFGNFAYNRNKVLSLGSVSSFEQGTELITVGLPLGSHFEVKWGGVDAATGAPLFYDANGKLTTNYNAAPAVQDFGTWEAPWKGGFGARLKYKVFEVSTLFSWQKGATKYNNLEYFVENPTQNFLGGGYNQAAGLRFWQKPGDIVSIPSPLYAPNFSSKLIHKADFLRWRDLTVSMSLPKSITDRAKIISSARFYIQGNNLMIWTPWVGMDPEAGSVNLNVSEFPNPRSFTAGLDITF